MSERSASGVPVADWLARLIDLLPEGGWTAPSPDETRALLDLARVAARASERVAAPLSTFLVGVAYASLPSAERASAVARLVETLEGPG